MPLYDALTETIRTAIREALKEMMVDPREPKLVSVAQCAEMLDLCSREIHNMIVRGELPAVSAGRRKLIDLKDIHRWIAANKRVW